MQEAEIDEGWPLAGLRITTADLLLRPLREHDLAEVADNLPSDLTLDPSLSRFPALPDRVTRRTAIYQGYWRSMGTWTTDEWQLPFAVVLGGEIVGTQALEGTRYETTRTVDSSSQLRAALRGRGLGQQMRRGILTLAFGLLEAERAITSAWHHNHASLGVSRALGYRITGETEEPSDTRPGLDTMVHLELSRAEWRRSNLASGIDIDGFAGCAPYFGL